MALNDLWTAFIGDWPTVTRTVLGAGLGTMLAQWFVPILHDRRKRKSHAAYMAMRLAVVLESYAAMCSDVIANNRNAETPPDEPWPDWNIHLPDLSPYPDDEDGWRALDTKLASRALDLRNRIRASQSLISSTIEYDEDGLELALNDQMSARGLEAWNIAVALRRRHSVKLADPIWDFAAHLEQTAAEVLTEKKAVEDRREKWLRHWDKTIEEPHATS